VNHPALAGPRHAAPASPVRRRRGYVRVAALLIAATAALGALTAPSAPPAEAAATKTFLGAAGDITGLAKKAKAPMAVHVYSKFHNRVPTNADMITVKTEATWGQVIAAKPGSRLYNQIATYARGVKALKRHVMVAYHHEPEASTSRRFGSPEHFKAAYRKVVSIFNAQGARNVEWTWQMTAYAFRAKASDRRAAARWYPGNAAVDNIGADGYSWGSCESGGGWVSPAQLAGPVVAFAKARGKKASLPEFGAVSDSRRAKWLRDLHTYLVKNRGVMTAAFYFNNGPKGPGINNCSWPLRTAAEFDAYGDIARNTAHFRS
jgi:Glycosyl hydrolase family 26